MIPTLITPAIKRLKLNFESLLSNFAFKFILRRCIKVALDVEVKKVGPER